MSAMTTRPGDAERGQVIASVDEYGKAQKIVDTLSDEGFPVDRVAIVGRDLQMIEDVTGRKRYGRAALEGAGSGAVTGALIGVFLSLFSLWTATVTWIGMIASWIVLGAIVGAVLGVIGHALQRGRRDFSSVSRMRAGTYEVRTASELVERARRTAGLDTASPGPA